MFTTSGSGRRLSGANLEETYHPQGALSAPALVSERGAEVLARLGSPISLKNEKEARRLLSEQCSCRLQDIGLNSSDLDALKKASSKSKGLNTLVATEPRSLLCATVRVGEAIAWYAVLEAFDAMESSSGGGFGREHTWTSWVSLRCTSTP